MPKYDIDKEEYVKLARACRVKIVGSKVAKPYAAGAVVLVSGNDKSQVLALGGKIVTGAQAKQSEKMENDPPKE